MPQSTNESRQVAGTETDSECAQRICEIVECGGVAYGVETVIAAHVASATKPLLDKLAVYENAAKVPDHLCPNCDAGLPEQCTCPKTLRTEILEAIGHASTLMAGDRVFDSDEAIKISDGLLAVIAMHYASTDNMILEIARAQIAPWKESLAGMVRVVERCEVIFEKEIRRNQLSAGVSSGWKWDDEVWKARALLGTSPERSAGDTSSPGGV